MAKFNEEFPRRSSTRSSTISSTNIAGLKMINSLNLEHDGLESDEAKVVKATKAWEATKAVRAKKALVPKVL